MLLLLGHVYSRGSSTAEGTSNTVLGIYIGCCIVLNLIASTSSNTLPFKVFLILGKREKSQGAMSVEYGG
jgi:hypothetical protein